MLKKIEGLSPKILGLQAEGTLTKSDYESVLMPMLEEEHRHGNRIRLLYQLGEGFTGITAGAAWDDFKVGLKYLRLFERCAIVTDIAWIRNATQFMGSFIPCPTRVFKNEEFQNAVAWLSLAEEKLNLKFSLAEDGVLVIKPHGPLRREDFDALANLVDPWIESHKKLQGVVISVEKFPGWENFGSFIRHFEFVSTHHRKVKRVALAVDGNLPEVMSKVASHFVEAEIKQFPFAKQEEAITWAKG